MQARSSKLNRANNNFNDLGYLFGEPRVQGTDLQELMEPRSVADAYCKFHYGLVLHIRGRLIGCEGKDFCAIFQRADMDLKAGNVDIQVGPEVINCGVVSLPSDQAEQSVLVPVFQVAENGKSRLYPGVERIRSLVRL